MIDITFQENHKYHNDLYKVCLWLELNKILK